MGIRRQAREAALQMLYLSDNCEFSPDEVLSYYRTLSLKNGSQEFAELLFKGTWNKRETLDRLITRYAQNWELERMAAIDRNILRMSAYEMLDMPETPINVIIDEAVEIA
jgi:N utilization substance protein B